MWWMRDPRNKSGQYGQQLIIALPLYAPDRNYIFRSGSLEKIQCAKKTDTPFAEGLHVIRILMHSLLLLIFL